MKPSQADNYDIEFQNGINTNCNYFINFITIDLTLEKNNNFEFEFFNKDLNKDQKLAVKSCLGAPEISIIHGPPGTGKTSTIIEIILQLLRINKTVLVCAPSNVAVDTLAERFVNAVNVSEFKVCRLGHPTRLLEQVKKISLDEIIQKKYQFVDDMKLLFDELLKMKKNKNLFDYSKENKIKEQISELGKFRLEKAIEIINECKLIFSTITMSGCKDLDSAIKAQDLGYFDVIIIDEAAQARTAESFIPIKLGKK